MAHNLNYNNRTGKYSFFSVKEKAWHNLGQIIQQYPTSKEAIESAGLDYEVCKTSLFTKGSGIIETTDGIDIVDAELNVPNYFANMRTDNNTVLGVVGKDYQIVQNREAFSFFDAIVGEGKVSCTKQQAHCVMVSEFLSPQNYRIISAWEMVMM